MLLSSVKANSSAFAGFASKTPLCHGDLGPVAAEPERSEDLEAAVSSVDLQRRVWVSLERNMQMVDAIAQER